MIDIALPCFRSTQWPYFKMGASCQFSLYFLFAGMFIFFAIPLVFLQKVKNFSLADEGQQESNPSSKKAWRNLCSYIVASVLLLQRLRDLNFLLLLSYWHEAINFWKLHYWYVVLHPSNSNPHGILDLIKERFNLIKCLPRFLFPGFIHCFLVPNIYSARLKI